MTSTTRDRWMVRAGVLGGLLGCLLAGIDPSVPDHGLPGVALGSTLVLSAERVGVLFAVWLLVVVVIAQAWRGQLPTEVSGRGVKYAESEGTQESVLAAATGLRELNHDVQQMRVELMRVEALARDEQEGIG
ncbi:MAG TPA: hypothetical protein VEX36_06305 [Thermoleophilaceae bacterium]|nr:hypothetical protein [Thermoleophilaceae bacterium]